MRLIAERLLPAGIRGRTYLQGELAFEPPWLPPPSPAKRFHVCCSPHNHGAAALMEELRAALDVPVLVTHEVADDVAACERFVVYLTRATWSGTTEDSEGLARHIQHAMAHGTRLLIVHESLGKDAPEARGDCHGVEP